MRLISLLCASALLSAPVVLTATPLVKSGETVAFMGDSITEQGANSPGGYVHLVESGLAANRLPVKIIPAGISGHKSNQMRDRLESDVLSKKPAWMSYLGNIMMARGVLRAFGLDDAQLAAASTMWLALTDAVPLQAKCKISLGEMDRLEALALSRKQSVTAMLEELMSGAVKNACVNAPAGNSAK